MQRKRIRTYSNSAVQTCQRTAFALLPRKSHNCKLCLICLKNTSICQRQRYRSATLPALHRRLLVKNSISRSLPSTHGLGIIGARAFVFEHHKFVAQETVPGALAEETTASHPAALRVSICNTRAESESIIP